MEPECYEPMSHRSQLVKGSNPLPPGDPIWAVKVALCPPYALLMLALWSPYGPLPPPLMVPFRPPLGCANVARPRDDFHCFPMIVNNFH